MAKKDLGEIINDSMGDNTAGNTRKRSTTLSQAVSAAKKTTTPKFTQLRGDQLIELDALTRELQAARTSKAERITANTVIRVAVDVILARRSVLVGNTEEQLKASVISYLEHLEGLESRVQELEEARSLEDQDSKTTKGK
ncbi:hypothetical protein ACIGZJ_36160 [Kitasatospora sp. NPDC052868]|uniref:hypothetical protein n=1 Tax=Kitasatospora sp. NPDC052868 TaxID=3364060 RepID=UPI0037C9FF7A